MFKFRPSMTILEKRENPADLQPMNPIILSTEGCDGSLCPPPIQQSTPTTPTSTSTGTAS